MTEKQCADKACDMLMRYVTDDTLRAYVTKVKKSGTIDFDDAKNDFRLPKCILSAFLAHHADQFINFMDKENIKARDAVRYSI